MFRQKETYELKVNNQIIGNIVIYSGISNKSNIQKRIHKTKDKYKIITFVK